MKVSDGKNSRKTATRPRKDPITYEPRLSASLSKWRVHICFTFSLLASASGNSRKLELSNKIKHKFWIVKFWTETVVYQIDHTPKLSLAAALNSNQAAGDNFFRADVIQKTWASWAWIGVPVMTSIAAGWPSHASSLWLHCFVLFSVFGGMPCCVCKCVCVCSHTRA